MPEPPPEQALAWSSRVGALPKLALLACAALGAQFVQLSPSVSVEDTGPTSAALSSYEMLLQLGGGSPAIELLVAELNLDLERHAQAAALATRLVPGLPAATSTGPAADARPAAPSLLAAHVYLAATYLVAGDADGGVATLATMVRQNPTAEANRRAVETLQRFGLQNRARRWSAPAEGSR